MPPEVGYEIATKPNRLIAWSPYQWKFNKAYIIFVCIKARTTKSQGQTYVSWRRVFLIKDNELTPLTYEESKDYIHKVYGVAMKDVPEPSEGTKVFIYHIGNQQIYIPKKTNYKKREKHG